MPKFSVVIPAFNREKYIATCILSVYEQSLTDFEIIVVDDGSLDDTYSILASFAEDKANFKLLKHDHNRGAAAARNTALKEVQSEFILWLDSDDILDPNILAEYDNAINAYPDVDVFYSQHLAYEESTAKELILDYGDWYKNRKDLLGTIFKKNPLPFGGVLTRTKVVKAVNGFDETFKCSIDYDFWTRLIEVDLAEFKLIKKPLYIYRFHDDNLAGLKLSDTQCQMNVRILKHILKTYSMQELFPEYEWDADVNEAERKSYLAVAKRFEARRAYDLSNEYKKKADDL